MKAPQLEEQVKDLVGFLPTLFKFGFRMFFRSLTTWKLEKDKYYDLDFLYCLNIK